MSALLKYTLSLLALASTLAIGQVVMVPPSQDVRSRVTLTKTELDQLLPSAGMSKMNEKGNTHRWTNDASGIFIISSDSKATGGEPSTSPGTWRIAKDGRYCLRIEWRTTNTEDWCRHVVRAGGAYYAVKPEKASGEKLFRLEISK